MDKEFVARVSVIIGAPVSKVWDALVNPEVVKQYFFGTWVVSDWKEGSSIVWKGEWQGKSYEDKGVILKIEPERSLVVTYYSPLSGTMDIPENYKKVSYTLTSMQKGTEVVVTQDNNANEDEKVHSETNWAMVLDGLKKLLE